MIVNKKAERKKKNQGNNMQYNLYGQFLALQKKGLKNRPPFPHKNLQ